MPELEPSYETVAWSHPLAAQLGGHDEVARVPVYPQPENQNHSYPDLESLPGVRDVSRLEGLVTTEEGKTYTIASFLSRQVLNDSIGSRD